MIHYFITWFEYNDHHEKCIRHKHMGGMKPEYQKAKGAARIIVLRLWGVILGRVTKTGRFFQKSPKIDGIKPVQI
jgi:hypothetical protein